jgi:dUTP pyrophosphatase
MELPNVIEVAINVADEGTLPVSAHEWDAGLDLAASERAVLPPAGGRCLVSTGIRLAIPYGFAGLVLPRSGMAIHHGVTLINAPGLVDSGYRGELRLAMVNLDPHKANTIEPGDRIAQLLIVPIAKVAWRRLTQLPPSDRGEQGFGSSGAR